MEIDQSTTETPGEPASERGGTRRRGRPRQQIWGRKALRGTREAAAPRQPDDKRRPGKDQNLPLRNSWTGRAAELSAAEGSGLDGGEGTRR